MATYNYKGCWNDTGNRAIPIFAGNMSPQQCEQVAQQTNSSVFGLQYYSQCFIGNNLGEAKKYGQAYNCPQNGGTWTNQVYSNIPDIQMTSGSYNYAGCYNDTGNRAIPNYKGNVSSVDQCQAIANNNSAMIFGVQDGGQCFTTNAITNNNQISQQINKAKQYGANNQCGPLGNAWTNQVYIRGKPFENPPTLNNTNFSN